MGLRIDVTVLRVTLVLLTGGFCLVGAGTAGLGGSPWLALGLFGLGAALRVVGTAVRDSSLGRFDDDVVTDLWVGPVVVGVVVLAWLDASAGEVQALGGLVGLVGMANYFLRPVYYLVYGVGTRLANV